MSSTIIWHGTQEESFDLVNAIARNCTCEFGLMGVRLTTCGPHKMLVEDQRALNGLLFVRRMADRLRAEEWSDKDPSEEVAESPAITRKAERLSRTRERSATGARP